MAKLGAWLAIASIISMVYRHRPVVTVTIAFALWTLLPAVAAYKIVGAINGPLATHPATWLVLTQVGACFISDPGRLGRAISRHILLAVMLPVFTVSAAAISVLNGYSGQRLLLDQVVGPAAAFLLIVTYGDLTSPARMLRGWIIGLAAVESVLALIQSQIGSVIFFEPDFGRLYWFNPEKFDRWMGTTDSPLVLSLLICVAAPLAVSLRNTALRLGTLMVLVLGVISTQSRTGVGVMACITIYMMVRGKMSFVTRVVCFILMVMTVREILQSSLVTGISSRLSNDTGSTAARGSALDFFMSQLGSISWVGHGLTSNYRIATEGGLITSLESSFMMFAIDLGLPLAILYFGTQVGLILWHTPGNRLQGAALGAMLGALVQHTFSALGYSNMSGFVIWCAMGLTVLGSTRFEAETPLTHAPARRRMAASAAV